MNPNERRSSNRQIRSSRLSSSVIAVCLLFFSPAIYLPTLASEGAGTAPSFDFTPDSDYFLVPAPGSTGYAYTNIVFSGSKYLCVWEERRNSSSYTLFGTRIDPNGNMLDAPSIRISDLSKDLNEPQQPSLATDGTDWMTAWAMESTPGGDLDIYGAIIGADGSLSGPFAIFTGPGDQDSPEVAYGGGVYLVVWEDNRKGLQHDDIYCAIVGIDGEVQTINAVCVAPNRQVDPAVASDGSGFMVLWEDGRGLDSDIYGARVTSSGTVLEPDGYVVSNARNNQRLADISFGSGKYLACWADLRNKQDWDIWGTFIETDGRVVHPNGLHICDATGRQETPTSCFGASRWLVVWEENPSATYHEIWGTLVLTDGRVTNDQGARIWDDPESLGPKLAYDGNRYLMTHGGSLISTVYNYFFPIGLWLDADATPVDAVPFDLGTGSNPQTGAAVSADSRRMLIVWEDGRNDESDLIGQVYFHSGNPSQLEKRNFVVGTGAQIDPALIYSHSRHYLFWADFRPGSRWGIYGARIDTLGDYVDAQDILVASNYPNFLFEPDVAASSTHLVVTWTDWGDHGTDVDYRIYARRIGFDGKYLDPGYNETAPAEYEQRHSRIAYGGGTFMMVWQGQLTSGDASVRYIFANRMTSEGDVPDLVPIQISGPGGAQYYPDIASDGESFMIVYLDDTGDGYRVMAVRVNPLGEALGRGAFVLSDYADFYSRPRISFDGVNYLAVWPDIRDNGYSSDLYVARITPQGILLDEDGIRLTDSVDNELEPAIATLSSNRSVIVHSDFLYGDHMSFRLNASFFGTTGIEAPDRPSDLPDKLYLLPNFPNPFNATTTITYGLPETGRVRLEVYNVLGQSVRTLMDGVQEAGRRTVVWDGADDRGKEAPSGLYFYRLTYGGRSLSGKMLYLK